MVPGRRSRTLLGLGIRLLGAAFLLLDPPSTAVARDHRDHDERDRDYREREHRDRARARSPRGRDDRNRKRAEDEDRDDREGREDRDDREDPEDRDDRDDRDGPEEADREDEDRDAEDDDDPVDTPPAPNRPPAITTSPVAAATANEPYAYDVDATDPDLDALTFSLTAAPAGMTVDPASGVITWTPTPVQLGSQPVTVRAADPGGLFDEQSFAVEVARTPNATPIVQAALAASVRPPRRFEVFFGEDLNRTENPATPLADDPVRPFSLPNTTAAQARFLRELAGDVHVETFEDVPVGAPPPCWTSAARRSSS